MTDYIALDARQVEAEIDAILAQFPELAEDEEFRADVLEGETGLHEVLGRIVRSAKDAEAIAEAIKSRKAELDARKARFEKRSEAMRSLAFRLLERAKQKKVVTPDGTVSIRTAAQTVIVTDETKLPDEFVKVERTPKKRDLLEALKSGTVISGAELSNGGQILSIRV